MADSLVMGREIKKEPYWVSYIRGRIAKKKNFLGMISGPTGSGKSWTGLSICSMVDPTFGPDRIITSMKQLMKLINYGKLKKGSAILWDEAGIDIDAKSWQSLTNKLINSLLQTFRHKQFILLFTAPYMDFIDAGTRKLFHAEFSVLSIDYTKKKTKIRPQLIQYNSRFKKFYYKYLRVTKPPRGVVKISKWNVPKPPNWLIGEYEAIKTDFTTKLNISIEKQLDSIENAKTTERKPLTELQTNVLTLMAKYDDVSKVAIELGITERTIYFHISQARRKKWNIEEFRGKKEARTPKTRDIL